MDSYRYAIRGTLRTGLTPCSSVKREDSRPPAEYRRRSPGKPSLSFTFTGSHYVTGIFGAISPRKDFLHFTITEFTSRIAEFISPR